MNFIINLFDEFYWITVDDQPDDESETFTLNLASLYAPEFQNYLRDDVQTTSFDLLQWWQSNKIKYPTLYKLFVMTSFTPASSSAVESEFSYAGLVITDRRCRILTEHVSQIMIARNDIT